MTKQNKKIEAAQKIAEKCSKAMHAEDCCAQALGIELEEIAPGTAIMTMKVRKDMVNGHNICHGGMIFTLADTCFAHACNSYNHVTVASGCTIDYIKPAMHNDTIKATAIEKSLGGRTGIYDVTIANQNDQTIAYFRGRSYRLQKQIIFEDEK